MSAFLEAGPFNARDGEGRVLLDNISLALEDAQFVAIEGPSGGGKSTLLRHLTGLAWSPDAERWLDGASYSCSKLPTWRSSVTLVAQDAPMVSGTVRDNLELPFNQRAGSGRSFDHEAATDMLARVGLAGLPLDREIRKVSGGERHRIALVRGLLWSPPVVVADEPISGLDPEAESASFELLLDFARRENKLVICVVHDPGLNARADRRFRLAEGRLEPVS